MTGFWTTAAGGPGGGLFPVERSARCFNRSGSAMLKGDVVQLDLSASVSEITTNDSASYRPGGETAVMRTVIDPTALGIRWGILGIVTETGGIANDAEGRVQFFGLVEEAYCISGDSLRLFSGYTNGMLVATTGNDLDNDHLSNERVVAIFQGPSVAAGNASSTRSLNKVLFNGMDFTFSVGVDTNSAV